MQRPCRAGLTPAAPAEFQSYQVVFDIVLPTATVEYTISGTDGYSFSETLTGDGNSNIVTGSSIPGGAAGVTDTITASISYEGLKVSTNKEIYVTFR